MKNRKGCRLGGILLMLALVLTLLLAGTTVALAEGEEYSITLIYLDENGYVIQNENVGDYVDQVEYMQGVVDPAHVPEDACIGLFISLRDGYTMAEDYPVALYDDVMTGVNSTSISTFDCSFVGEGGYNVMFNMPRGPVTITFKFKDVLWEQFFKGINDSDIIDLPRDLTMESSVTVSRDRILNLKGHKLDGSGIETPFTIKENSSLTVNGGEGDDMGEMLGSILVNSGGSFTINDAKITGADADYAVTVKAGGTFTMNGGTITGNKDGGVYVENGGVFTVSGGASITGNTYNDEGVVVTRDVVLADGAEIRITGDASIGISNDDYDDAKINLSIVPKDGYELGSLTYTPENETTTAITPDEDGKCSFTIPVGENGTVDATFVEKKIYVHSSSLTLNGEIGLNFFITVPPETVTAGAKAVLNGPNGEVTVTLSEYTKDSEGRYKLTYLLNAIQMDKTVTLEVQDAQGVPLDIFIKKTGEQIENNKLAHSINAYIRNAKEIPDEKLQDLMSAMYTYGAYAAHLFNKEIQIPADASPLPDTVDADALDDYKSTTSGRIPDDIQITSATLVLDSKTAFRVYFTAENGLEGHAFTLDEIAVTPQPKGEKFYVEVNNIAANDLKKEHALKIDKNYTITFSALTYVYNVLEKSNDEALRNAVKALYMYSQAADAYFNPERGSEDGKEL